MARKSKEEVITSSLVPKQFKLNLDDRMHREVYEFTNKCPRSLSQLCVIALYELMETYHLKDATPEKIKGLIDFYEYYQSKMQKQQQCNTITYDSLLALLGNIVAMQPKTDIPPGDDSENNTPEETEQDSGLVDEHAKMLMANIMESDWG